LPLDCQPEIRSVFVYCPLNRLDAATLEVRIEKSQTGLSSLRYWGEDAARLHAAAPPTQREAD
jgi:hypothetical protein